MEKSEFFSGARSDIPGPLAGVRVLEATTSWAGPMCACVLADLGADVIKVEDPQGEVARRLPPFLPGTTPPVSFAQATVNRNKRSLTLDLRTPRGREIFLALTQQSDIVVQNFRPGTLDKWGVGFAECRRVKPDIIYVSISGFGQFGPIHDRVGYDPLAQALSGFMSLNGAVDGAPSKAPTFLCDDLAGLHGAIAALAALRHRAITGEGQHCDVALLDAMLFQSNGYPTLGALGLAPPRMGNEFGFSVPTNTFHCRDGIVMLGTLLIRTGRCWRGLSAVPSLATIRNTPKSRRASRIAASATRWLRGGAPSARSSRLSRSVRARRLRASRSRPMPRRRDPHVLARDMMQPTAQEGGATAPIVGPPAKFSRTPTRVRTGSAALGAHNDEILKTLGIDAAARKRLKADGII